MNSGSESWTGIGVVAGCAAVMLITQGPLVKKMDAGWRTTLRQILQEVRRIRKTRNQLKSRSMSTLSPLGPLCEERDRLLHQGIDFHITVVHCLCSVLQKKDLAR